MNKLYIDFEDVKKGIDELKLDYKVDTIICLTRGGLVPAGLLAYKLDCKDIINLKVQSYIDQERHEIDLEPLHYGDIIKIQESKNILIVDDVYDSGETMKAVYSYLGGIAGESTVNLNSFCVIQKQDNDVLNHVLFEGDLNTWVVFPWDFA